MAQLADAYGLDSTMTVFLSPPSDFKQVKFHIFIFAGVAELADALASGASVRKDVWVQVPPSAPRKARKCELFLFAFSYWSLSGPYWYLPPQPVQTAVFSSSFLSSRTFAMAFPALILAS